MPAPSARPVLVVGATGFVGRAVAPALLAAGRAVRAATREKVVRELVQGLEHDLLPEEGASFWDAIARRRLVPFDEAARRALAEERPAPGLRGALGAFGEAVVQAVGTRLGGKSGSPPLARRLPVRVNRGASRAPRR